MINISRWIAFPLAYMLHNWFSIILIAWITHSYRIESYIKFRVTTMRFYLPLIILYYLWEFIVNIDMLFPDKLFSKEAVSTRQYTQWGMIRFGAAIWPMMIFNLLIYSMFSWIKIGEQIFSNVTDKALCENWITSVAKNESSTLQLLLFLHAPIWEYILLLLITCNGLTKPNIYHMFYIVSLIAYLNFPKHKRSITKWLIIYGSFFIILKYVYTLLDVEDKNIQEIFKLFGINTSYIKGQEFTIFEYPPKYYQWFVICAGSIQFYMLDKFSNT